MTLPDLSVQAGELHGFSSCQQSSSTAPAAATLRAADPSEGWLQEFSRQESLHSTRATTSSCSPQRSEVGSKPRHHHQAPSSRASSRQQLSLSDLILPVVGVEDGSPEHELWKSRTATPKGSRRASFGSEVDEIRVLAQGHHWLVASALDSSEAPRPTKDITLAVLVTDLEHARGAVDLVRDLRSQTDQLPILAVIVGVDAGRSRPGVLQAQQVFRREGVDDVLVKCGGYSDLELALLMRLDQVLYQRRHTAKLEECLEDAHSRKLEDETSPAPEANNGLFWDCVDRMFSRFPKLDSSVARRLEMGMPVGGCKLESYIGHGALGSVYAARSLDHTERRAVKVMLKDRLDTLDEVCAVWREMRLMQKLKHEHIAILYDVIHGPHHLFIVMELVGERNLFRVLKTLGGSCDVQQAQQVHFQLTSAVAHCHEKGVGHRDIKPENIAVSDDGIQIKLLDFGRAVQLGRPCLERTGTRPFLAPEVVAASQAVPYDAAPADVWACGMVLFEMLCGISIFDKMLAWVGFTMPCTQKQVYTFLTKRVDAFVEVLHQVHPKHSDKNLDDLLLGMFEADPAQRWPAHQTVDCGWVRSADLDQRCSSPLDPMSQGSEPKVDLPAYTSLA